MTYVIIFTIGYFMGGVTALIIIGLTLAARRGDRGHNANTHFEQVEDRSSAWRKNH